MNTIGVVLLVAATATTGIDKPGVRGRLFLRHHAVANGPAPPGGMVDSGPTTGHPGPQAGRRFPNVRSQVFFVDPPGMKIGWQTAAGGNERVYLPAQLTVPARYNFTQGYIYRLKLTDIPNRAGLTLYPTIEVAPSTPATDAYLTHNPIPAIFTEEDFDQVQAGNFVTKVIYLPDPKFQELAIAGVETLVSTRLEPGVDPILEADRRGTILMIVRLGAIDLEMPNAGTMVPSNVGGAVPGTALPPAIMNQPGAAVVPSVPVDNTAPVSPAVPAPAPAAEPAKPGDQPAKPADDPTKPGDQPAKPANDPNKPGDASGPLAEPPGGQPPVADPPANSPNS